MRDPSSLPFGDGSFDVVVCRQGLQLLPDRGRALAEMWRVLVPSGRVAVASSGRIERSPAFPSVAEFLRRYLPRSMIGSTGTHPSDGERRVAADLEAELAPWVDADGLRIATEVNTGVATR